MSPAPRVDIRRLRKLYGSDPAARIILDHLASRDRSWRTTSVDQLLSTLRAVEEDVSRGEAIGVFKELEECGCGQFKAGRKGWPSRFEWTVQMVGVGQAAAGETEQIEEVTEADLAEEESRASLRHTYRLRPDVAISLDLPKDLTPGEAERLAQYIRTLPFEPVPSQSGDDPPPRREPAATGSAARRPTGSDQPVLRSERKQRIGYATSSRVPPGRRHR